MIKNYKKQIYHVLVNPSIDKERMYVTAEVVTSFEVDGKSYTNTQEINVGSFVDKDIAQKFWEEVEKAVEIKISLQARDN